MAKVWSRWWRWGEGRDSGWIRKEEPIGLAEETHVGGKERGRGDPEDSGLSNRRDKVSSPEKREAAGGAKSNGMKPTRSARESISAF